MIEKIYKAEVNAPTGIFLVAVLETEDFARETIQCLIQSDMNLAWGSFRVSEPQKSTRKLLASMQPVKHAHDSKIGQWGWIKKLPERKWKYGTETVASIQAELNEVEVD